MDSLLPHVAPVVVEEIVKPVVVKLPKVVVAAAQVAEAAEAVIVADE